MSWICPKCNAENADFVLDDIKKTECLCGYNKSSVIAGDSESTRKCPCCAETILLDAKKCKHCGEWIDNISSKTDQSNQSQFKNVASIKRKGIVLPTLAFILIGFIISVAFIDDKPKKTTTKPKQKTITTQKKSKPREVVYNSAWDGSVYQIERYLKKNLKDPKSFETIDWSPVQKVDLTSHKYIVRCKYRAKIHLVVT